VLPSGVPARLPEPEFRGVYCLRNGADNTKVPHHLLLADDSVTIQRVIKLTFADEDVEVVTVGDGDQAVAAIDSAPPDIVLADVAMPGRSGYDVAQHIRDTPRLAHIPVVLLTGAFEPVDEARASQVGCDVVLAKPFEPELVVSRVRELLSRPRATAVLAPAPPAPTVPDRAVPSSASVAVPPAPVHQPALATVPPALATQPAVPAALPSVAAPAAEAFMPAAPSAAATEAAAPEPAQSKGSNAADIDAYFDRLDEAFATLATAPRPMPSPSPEGRPAPSLALVPPGAWSRSVPAPEVPASGPPEPAVRSLVEAFEGLLGPQEPAVTPAPLPTAPRQVAVPAAAESVALSEAQMSQIVDRVVERLTERLGGGTLGDVVSRVAERLVREEIAQIKKRL
jgi:CheY-like chemotaxis protein